eukprot:1384516-Amphidinium_carterae.1
MEAGPKCPVHAFLADRSVHHWLGQRASLQDASVVARHLGPSCGGECQLVLKGYCPCRCPKARRVGRSMIRHVGADGRTNGFIVQSSQFGCGFDCTNTHKGGGRDAKGGRNWLAEDLGRI